MCTSQYVVFRDGAVSRCAVGFAIMSGLSLRSPSLCAFIIAQKGGFVKGFGKVFYELFVNKLCPTGVTICSYIVHNCGT